MGTIKIAFNPEDSSVFKAALRDAGELAGLEIEWFDGQWEASNAGGEHPLAGEVYSRLCSCVSSSYDEDGEIANAIPGLCRSVGDEIRKMLA